MDNTTEVPNPEDFTGGQRGSSSSREDRFRDAFGGAGFSFKSVRDAMRDVEQQAEDTFYSLFPPDVTQHLVNSQKELLQAGRRVGEMLSEKAARCADRRMEELDRKAARAREVHERMKAEREAARAAEQAAAADPSI